MAFGSGMTQLNQGYLDEGASKTKRVLARGDQAVFQAMSNVTTGVAAPTVAVSAAIQYFFNS